MQFQSTHPSGVRRNGKLRMIYGYNISIHAPQWGATDRPRGGPPAMFISIHAPQWGATPIHSNDCHIRYISIHAPQWGATSGPRVSAPITVFQSTHPSGVRLAAINGDWSGVWISIHAPQWGATATRMELRGGRGISIHAPQWGATLSTQQLNKGGVNFNPRTPVGCDDMDAIDGEGRWVFQSTHPSGVRPQRAMTALCGLMAFQSTHPSGVRLPLACGASVE